MVHTTAAVLSRATEEIFRQLRLIASQQGQSADFARDVESLRSTTIEFDDPNYSRHDPEARSDMRGHTIRMSSELAGDASCRL